MVVKKVSVLSSNRHTLRINREKVSAFKQFQQVYLQGKKHQKNQLKSKSTNPDFECELCLQEFDNYHDLSKNKSKKLTGMVFDSSSFKKNNLKNQINILGKSEFSKY